MASEEALDIIDDEELLDCATAALADIVEAMGMQVDVDGHFGDEQQIRLELSGEDAERLIGKKGQTLDALQMIVGKMVSRRAGRRQHVVVDAEGYRQRRADSLVELAERLSQKAIDEGQVVALNPMSPHDRRIIHIALREMDGISTRSEGEGDDRRLLIIPD